MVKVTDLLSLEYYKKTSFTGSHGNMRYKIEKIEIQQEADSDNSDGEAVTTKKLAVYTWPGPYAFFQTDDSLKQRELFPFANESLEPIAQYLNSKISEYDS